MAGGGRRLRKALQLAVDCDHPVYHTLFVALAISEATRVITFDRRLLARFPEHAISASASVAKAR